jgi:hypothetical protein
MKKNISITVEEKDLDGIKITSQVIGISLSQLIENMIIAYNKNCMSKDVSIISKENIKMLFSLVQKIENSYQKNEEYNREILIDFNTIKCDLLNSL